MELHTRSVNVTQQLQQFGILVGSKITSWSGSYTPPRQSLPQQANTAVVQGLSRQGQLILVPQNELSRFSAIRARVDSHLRGVGNPFPLFNGMFFIMLDDLPGVTRFLCDTIIPEFQRELDAFMERLPEIKRARNALFDNIYPDRAGFLLDKYPSDDDIRGRFSITRCVLNWAPPAIGQVTEQEMANFSAQTQDFVQELALDLRKTAVEACLAFKRALSTKSGEVNDKAIAKFRAMLDKIERHNILGDQQMIDLITRIRTNVFAVQNWSSETELKDLIKSHLDEVVQAGDDAGAAAAVASQFVRRVGDGDDAADDSQEAPAAEVEASRIQRPESTEVPETVLDTDAHRVSRATPEIPEDSDIV